MNPTKIKPDSPFKIDETSKKLLKFDLFLLISLVVSLISYYQIKDYFELNHDVALAYSILLGFGMAGLIVWARK